MSGLYNFRARQYDGDAGIFYAADPASSSFSPYGYVSGNPVSRVDPTGMVDINGTIMAWQQRRDIYNRHVGPDPTTVGPQGDDDQGYLITKHSNGDEEICPVGTLQRDAAYVPASLVLPNGGYVQVGHEAGTDDFGHSVIRITVSYTGRSQREVSVSDYSGRLITTGWHTWSQTYTFPGAISTSPPPGAKAFAGDFDWKKAEESALALSLITDGADGVIRYTPGLEKVAGKALSGHYTGALKGAGIVLGIGSALMSSGEFYDRPNFHNGLMMTVDWGAVVFRDLIAPEYGIAIGVSELIYDKLDPQDR
jgi:hypothetical protein